MSRRRGPVSDARRELDRLAAAYARAQDDVHATWCPSKDELVEAVLRLGRALRVRRRGPRIRSTTPPA